MIQATSHIVDQSGVKTVCGLMLSQNRLKAISSAGKTIQWAHRDYTKQSEVEECSTCFPKEASD